MRQRIALGLITCLALTVAAHGQRQDLKVGDQAPGLDIEEWVKGKETTLETGNVYVVEFWATWCGPCRRSIPHLTELQEGYADDGLTIIGISTEEVDTVKPFVKRQGSKMNYTVAVDRRKATQRAWFDAAGLRGIPAAFIVDRQGKIAFIGNPLQEDFDDVIYEVLKGRYDPVLQKNAKPAIQRARTQRQMRNYRMALKHYEEVIEVDPRIFAELALEKFHMMLVDMDDPDEAYKYARESLIGKHFVDDPGAMVMLAEKIAGDPDIPDAKRNMDVAMEAAQGAMRLAGADNPHALAAVAMVHFHRGEFEQAYERQYDAWKIVKQKYKPEYRRQLMTYKKARQDA